MRLNWQGSIHIHKPLDQVYAYLADFPRHCEWAQTLVKMEQVRAGDGSGVGAQYLTHERQAFQSDRGPHEPVKKGMPAKTLCEVRELAPNQRISWHSHMVGGKALMYSDLGFTLASDGNGGTQLTQTIDFTAGPVPTWLGKLMGVDRKQFAQAEASLRNIKQILERSEQ